MTVFGPNTISIGDRPHLSGTGTHRALGRRPDHLARNRSAAITLVEKSSGYQIAYALGHPYNTERVAAKLVEWIEIIPAAMCGSLT